MIWTTLLFGLLMGLRHALEVDHVAAVASLAARSAEARRIVGLGALWGLGHTLTLFTFGMMVLLLDAVIPQRLALSLELAVGVLLVILGGDIVGRMILARVHFHMPRHADDLRGCRSARKHPVGPSPQRSCQPRARRNCRPSRTSSGSRKGLPPLEKWRS